MHEDFLPSKPHMQRSRWKGCMGEGRIERRVCVWNLEQCWGATVQGLRAMGQVVGPPPPAELMKYRLFIALLTMYLHLSPSLFQPPSPC